MRSTRDAGESMYPLCPRIRSGSTVMPGAVSSEDAS